MNYIELNNEVMNRKNGFFQLEKDQQAAAEFLKEVKRKSKKFDSILDKVKWMVQSDFYYDVFAEYSEEEVLSIYNFAYCEKFEFKSYMAASKFYKEYAVKTDDKGQYLETYEDRVSIVSLYLGRGISNKQ